MSTPNADWEALGARSQTRRTPSPWGEVVWRRWGPRDAPDVVLLHGGTGSWLHWVTTIPAIEAAYQVWVPDLPGMGKSDAPDKMEPVEEMVEAMGAACLSGLNALTEDRPVHVVGFSFGSMVGAFLAAWRGTGCRSYTVIGGSGLGLRYKGPGALMKPSPDLDAAQMRAVHQHNMGAVMFGNPDYRDEAALEMQLLNAADMRIRSHTAAATRVMLAPLSEMVAPKYAFWGAADPFLPADREEFESLMRQFDMTWSLIEGAGHWANYQGAESFNAALSEILARHA